MNRARLTYALVNLALVAAWLAQSPSENVKLGRRN